MPLESFGNYDDYWKKRIADNKLPADMVRYKVGLESIGNDGMVLDIGAGIGEFLDYLLLKKANLKLIGTEISDSCLNELKRKKSQKYVLMLRLKP